MLSPESWHKSVPRTPTANLKFRLSILDDSKRDKSFRTAMFEACRQDLLFYVNTFVWQYNPRKPGSEVEPFVSWPFQDEAFRILLDCIECHCQEKSAGAVHQHDLVCEKSREMGATWWFLITADWLARFHERKQLLMISRNQDAVESESPNSLFWKLDFIEEHLPGWMKRQGDRRKMHIGYGRGSSITGEASTGKAGVGGRATVMFVDEYGLIREDFEVLQRTADTSGCRLFNSTHYGTSTAFYELTRRPDWRKVTMHWSQHPLKNHGRYIYSPEENSVEVLDNVPELIDYQFVRTGLPAGGPFPGLRSIWYDQECDRRGDARDVAEALDIDVKGSQSQFFDALKIRQLQTQYGQEPVFEGDLDYDRDSAKPTRLVEFAGGPLKLWINPLMDLTVPKSEYTCGGDISTGAGATPSCLSIGDAIKCMKVAEYKNSRLDPNDFAIFSVALCRLFENEYGEGAQFAWEMAGPGMKFGMKVVELGYRRIYFRRNEFELAGIISDRPGWYPSPSSTRMVLADYRSALFNHEYVNRSRDSLDECLAFIDNGKEIEHDHYRSKDPATAMVNHSDQAIADALAYMMVKLMGLGTPKEQSVTTIPIGSFMYRRELREKTRSAALEEWA